MRIPVGPVKLTSENRIQNSESMDTQNHSKLELRTQSGGGAVGKQQLFHQMGHDSVPLGGFKFG